MMQDEGGSMPGRTAKARKTKPPRDRSMLLGPAPDFKMLEAAMQNPDEAHALTRESEIRLAAALVYLNNNIGDVLQAIVKKVLNGERNDVLAARLLLEITGVKKVGRGSTKRDPEVEVEDGTDTAEFDEILKDAAQVFPIGTDREGTGGH